MQPFHLQWAGALQVPSPAELAAMRAAARELLRPLQPQPPALHDTAALESSSVIISHYQSSSPTAVAEARLRELLSQPLLSPSGERLAQGLPIRQQMRKPADARMQHRVAYQPTGTTPNAAG